MEFDDIIVKDSPGICRCCLSEGCYKDLGSEYSWMDETEIYADMLLECFDVGISQHVEGPNGPNRLICEVCITRLRDACNFKKQVLDTEKKFIDMVAKGQFKPKNYNEQLKVESIPARHVEETEVEYLEEIDYDDISKDRDYSEPSISEDIIVDTLPIKGKRGRPKKTSAKTEKKKAKTEDKTKMIVKGDESPKMATVPPSKSSMTSTKRNRVMKRNAINILETSTVVPFKWHRHNYLCFYCHRPFKTLDPLKEHTRNDHRDSNVKSAVTFLKRDEKVKIDVSLINCRLCEQNFDSIDSIIEHVKENHNRVFSDSNYGVIPYKFSGNSYKCAICAVDFHYFTKLNQHMNKHFGQYVCELCGKSFLSKERLRCHSLSHGSSFRCGYCSDTFDTLTSKRQHEYSVHDKKSRIRCLYCPQDFNNYVQRKLHHSDVHGQALSLTNCPVCSKSFHIASKMRTHMKEVHMREKNFSCTLCDQKFFSRSHVQKHMVKHSGDKIHTCEVCNKSYARKQTLRDHMRIHNNDRRFICTLCNQAFIQNNGLRLHMRLHHPESSNS